MLSSGNLTDREGKIISLRSANLKGNEIKTSIVGDSDEMREVWNMVETFAPSDVEILLEGETGTGKDLFAMLIHEMSERRNGPFCAIDCSSLPESILESEMFGYEKGTFTGATEKKPGRFELAKGGTLFFDEVSNFSFNIQAKLLRVIQERKFYPLGTKKLNPIELDCRIIAASNQSLREAVRKGTFREDLFYRLNTVTIDIPPLNRRKGDLKLLVQYFIGRCNERFNKNVSGVCSDVLGIFESHHWPGNVRELENVINYSVLSAVDTIMPWHLPEYLRESVRRSIRSLADEESLPEPSHRIDNMNKEVEINIEFTFNVGESRDFKRLASEVHEHVERKILFEVMKRTHMNKCQLSRFLGIDSKTLRAKLRKLNFEDNY